MDSIKIKDRSFSHSKLGYCSDYQTSKIFYWDRKVDEDYETVYTDMVLNQAPKNKKNYAWLIEPVDIAKQNYSLIRNVEDRYKKIFTHEKTLLDLGSPYEFVPFGCCWIREEDQKIYKKNKNISIISSNKKSTNGHHLRHEIINSKLNGVDVYGRGWNEISYKLEGLKDYRFSIVVENAKRDYWFTEKLIDCLVTGTIPIYWGCPSIGDFFDLNGFIVFDNLKELKDIYLSLTEEKYNNMLNSVLKNFELSKQFLLPDEWVYKKVKNL